jgi:hypothetical protein
MKLFNSIYYYLCRKWNKVLDLIYFRYFNPYYIRPFGVCPVQAWGKIKGTKEYYYFRSRGSKWSLEVSKYEMPDVLDELKNNYDNKLSLFFDNVIWSYTEEKYKWPDAGWISKGQAIKFATFAINKYLKENGG